MMKIVFFLSFLFGSVCVNAQNTKNVSPESIHVIPEANAFVFYATVNEGTTPACAGLNRWAIALDVAGVE